MASDTTPILYLDETRMKVIRDMLDRRGVVHLGESKHLPIPLADFECAIVLDLVEEDDSPECQELARELREAMRGRT